MAATSAATAKWLKYFAEAGLPSNVSANYAIIFTENRIQPDMLLDLNKEYLYDMGIKVMGDVIAILRHARTAYTQQAQQKILGEQIVTKHFTQPQPVIQPRVAPQPIPPQKQQPQKTSQKSVISLKRTSEESAEPLQTKKVMKLAAKPTVSIVKGSVFRRLGESSVSSTTDNAPEPNSIFKRLGPSANELTRDDELQYRGILKSSLAQKKPITFSTTTPETNPKTVVNKLLPTKTIITGRPMIQTVHRRLGGLQPPPTSSSAVSTTTFGRTNLLLKRAIATPSRTARNNTVRLSSITSQQAQMKKRLLLHSINKQLTASSNSQSLYSRQVAAPSPIVYSQRIVKKPTRISLKKNVFDRLGPNDDD